MKLKWGWDILTKSHCLNWNFFFQMLLKIFCRLYRHVQGIWKVQMILFFVSVKKSWPYDTPIRLYVRKSEKSWDFKKKEAEMRLEYSDKTLFFGAKLFLKKPLQTFLWTLRACSRYLKSLQSLYLCTSKKSMTVRHTNQIICREKWKKLRR